MEEARNQLLNESKEEIGLTHSKAELIPTSLQIDKLSVHHELTFIAKTKLSSDEIAINARQSREGNEVSFPENIAILEATPEVIELLLTDVRTPFSPTHAGALLMAGYHLVQQAESQSKANEWLVRVSKEMDRNYRSIDKIAGGSYKPDISAEEQGLPSFQDELKRLFAQEFLCISPGESEKGS